MTAGIKPRALVIRLTAFGDVLLTAPLLAALAETHEVHVVTSPVYVPVVAAIDGVCAVHGLDRATGVKGARVLGAQLAGTGFEVVLDLQHKVRSIALAKAVRAPVRAALKRRTWPQLFKAAVGLDTVLDAEHQVWRYLSMLVHVPGGQARYEALRAASTVPLPALCVPPAARAEADALFAAADAPGAAGIVAVAPCATHATKGWPITHFAALTAARMDAGQPVLLVGGPNDGAALDAFREAFAARTGPSAGTQGPIVDARTLSPLGLAAALTRARILVSNDSGPVHLARLLRVASLTVFGPTSVTRWGPMPGHTAGHRAVQATLECAPCSNHGQPRCPKGHHACMQDLSVAQVGKSLALLEADAAAGRPGAREAR